MDMACNGPICLKSSFLCAGTLVQRFTLYPRSKMNTSRSNFDLTRRELEVLVKMAEGFTQREIAEQLFVSPNTVNSHAQKIYEKMDVHTGVHAVAKAFRHSLIT